ncbi:MAG: MATE family multidrug resistance protein [Polaribacter sp.]|jgi:MATE family multidrug resistance protein
MWQNYKKELKDMLPIGIPAVLSQLAQMITGFIDTLMAGHYSTDALAAIAIGTSLLHPVLVFFLGLFLALNPIVAHFKGAGEVKKITTHFNASILIALAVLPLAIIALLNAPFILAKLNIEPNISQVASDYLFATLWGWPGLLLFLAIRFINEGLFSTKAIMLITGASIPFNIIFNYWFMYGGLGITEMGAVGVGYATAVTWTLMFIGLLIYTITAKKYRQYQFLKDLELPSIDEIKAIFTLGLPLAITLGFEITMFAAVSLMIARYPTEIMASHQIAVNLASLTFMIPLGLSQAITARVSYFRAQGKIESMRLAGNTGIFLSISIMSASAIMFMSIPTLLVSIYTQDTELLKIASSLLFFAAVFQFSDGLQVACAGCLRGLKDTKIPMVITAIAYWLVGFPTGYYLAEYQGYGVNGYWIGLITGLSVAAVLLLHRWISHFKDQTSF